MEDEIMNTTNDDDDNNTIRQQQQQQLSCQTCNKKKSDASSRKLFRCSKCRKVYYCSIECQKLDWKNGGHRQVCQRSSSKDEGEDKNKTTATATTTTSTTTNSHDAALQELLSLATNLTINESIEQYHKTNDEIKRQKQQTNQNKITTSQQREEKLMDMKVKQRHAKRGTNQNGMSSTSVNEASSSSSSGRKGMRNNDIINKGFLIPSSSKHHAPPDPSSMATTPIGGDSESQNYNYDNDSNNIYFVAEEMKYVSQLRILIRRKRKRTNDDINGNNDIIDFNTITKQVTNANNNAATLLLTLKCQKSNKIIFEAEIPKSYDTKNCTIHIEGDHTIHVRIMNTDNNIVDKEYGYLEFLSKGNLSIEDINDIQCKYCKHPLLPPLQTKSSRQPIIQRVLQLPTGHLEDIADYLICYSGQPTVDFASTGSITDPHVALQDSTVICLHMDALLLGKHNSNGTASSSVCVLAVPGYGEEDDGNYNYVFGDTNDQSQEDSTKSNQIKKSNNDNKMTDILDNPSATIRGERPWRDGGSSSGGGGVGGRDDGDGATVCCSICCSQLGFALSSNATYRLLKHRLQNSQGQQLSSTASFLAREMARYADVKAIFTFVVFRQPQSEDHPQQATDLINVQNLNNKNKSDIGHHRRGSLRKCILLRLVSWDSRMATSYFDDGEDRAGVVYGSNGTGNDSQSSRRLLQFRQVAKIVFEETYEKIVINDEKNNENEDDNIITSMTTKKWIWGGVDLCCEPFPPPPPPPLNYHSKKEDDDAISMIGGKQTQQQQQQNNSTVRLQLPYDEYDEVLKSLHDGTKLFTKDVADTTILVKMGGGSGNDGGGNNLALTAIALDQ